MTTTNHPHHEAIEIEGLEENTNRDRIRAAYPRAAKYQGKAYISSICRLTDLTKLDLIAAHRAGEITLVAANLVDAQDVSLVSASELDMGGGPLHFVILD